MAAQAEPGEPRVITLALMSKTGSGKSSLGNALLGKKDGFKVGHGGESETNKCECLEGMVADKPVSIVDTPGAVDTRDTDAALKEICSAITLCPNGIHAFLLVVRADVRLTNDEELAIRMLEHIFGKKFYDYGIVVFSHGDSFGNDEAKFETSLKKTRAKIKFLSELLDNCMNRYLLMDSSENCPTEVRHRQVCKLMDMVHKLVEENGESKYTNEFFQYAQRRIEEEKKKREREEREKQEAEKRRQEAEIKEREAKIRKEFEEKMRKAELYHLRTEKENLENQLKNVRLEVAEQMKAMRAENEKAELERKQTHERETSQNVAGELKEKIKKEGGSCFPWDATVQTPEGPVRMRDLRLGQRVLACRDGRLAFSPVYMWGHRDEETSSSKYTIVRTSEGAEVTLSADHLLFVMDASGRRTGVPAGCVRPGDSVAQALEASTGLRSVRVVSVQRGVTRRGLFAPFTASGTVLVNGVLASCYVNCLPHGLSHALLWPVRSAWGRAPAAVAACNRLGSVPDSTMPGWVTFAARRVLPRLKWLAVEDRGSGMEDGVDGTTV